MPTNSPDRRGFLARLSAVAAALAVGGAPATAAAASTSDSDAPEPWLRALTGKHKQIFHSHDKMDGTVLGQARTFYDLYESAYGQKSRDVNVVVAAHGATGAMLLADALWAKYELGAMYKVTMRNPDAAVAATAATVASPAPAGSAAGAQGDGKPAARIPVTRNIFWAPQPGDGVESRYSVQTLMSMGAQFLVCDNALKQFAGYTARKSGMSTDAAYAELRAGVVPGAIVVPTMVIAINRAQQHGCSYMYCG